MANPAPTGYYLSPAVIPAAGGVPLQVVGRDVDAASVAATVGGTAVATVVAVSRFLVNMRAPAHAAGSTPGQRHIARSRSRPAYVRQSGQSVPMAGEGEIRRLPDEEVDGEEGWERLTDEPEIRGVEATRHDDDDWPWSVVVWVMEFVREEPLESEIRHAMIVTLWAVPDVTAVAEEDREVWIVAGSPSGEALVRAAATVVDAFVARARAHVASLMQQNPDAP